MNFMFIQLNHIEIPEKNFFIISQDVTKNMELYLASPALSMTYKGTTMTDVVSHSPIFEDLGKYDAAALLRKPMICIWEETEAQELGFNGDKRKADQYYSRKSLRYSDLAMLFSLATWFVKDCSVYSDLCYQYNTDIDYSVKSRRSFQQTNAVGEMQLTFFDEEEINMALKYLLLLMEIAFSNMDRNEQIGSVYSQETLILNVETAINNNGDSFSRILILLQLARKTGFLVEKISWYCVLLECLFNIERDHKKNISEMTSSFIAENQKEKEEIAQNMRLAYKVRSEFVHGNVIGLFEKHEQMVLLSGKVDEYVRRALRKAFIDRNFNYRNTPADKKRVRNYFGNM